MEITQVLFYLPPAIRPTQPRMSVSLTTLSETPLKRHILLSKNSKSVYFTEKLLCDQAYSVAQKRQQRLHV